MASEGSSSGHEHAQGGDAILPDVPVPTLEIGQDTEAETEESSSDGMSFLTEPLPRLPLNSSDDDLYEPDSADEDEGSEGPTEVVKAEEDEDNVILDRTPSPWAPLKRQPDDARLDDRPYKKARGTAFNHGYLAILNTDIEDAAAQYVPHEETHLSPSQVGMTVWTSVEKELFFEALSRLGKDDIQGISRRIRTKGELEVRQYLKLLQDAASGQTRERRLRPACPEDMPAAIEIGPQCSAALEEAADAVASRQETYEETLERKRWDDNWLVTPFNYKSMEAPAAEDMPSLQLFRVSSWLRLPERVFMNANFAENNWQTFSDENPSIRATALEDFYSLAVSVTKRLVAATIFVAQSRIRAKKDVHFKSEAKKLVWRKDVEAAALSVGLNRDSTKFWAGCARRLRLDVYDDDDNGASSAGSDADSDVDADAEPMTYDEVEAALGGATERDPFAPPAEHDSEEEELMSLSDTPSLDELSDPEDQQLAREGAQYEPPSAQPQTEGDGDLGLDIDEEAVRAETKELLLYTAQCEPPTTRTRQMAEYRIRNGLQHLAYVDALDAKASRREERRLWEMLGRDPPDELVKVKVPERAPRSIWQSVDDMYPPTRDWREGLRYVSDWERTLEEGNGSKVRRRDPG